MLESLHGECIIQSVVFTVCLNFEAQKYQTHTFKAVRRYAMNKQLAKALAVLTFAVVAPLASAARSLGRLIFLVVLQPWHLMALVARRQLQLLPPPP